MSTPIDDAVITSADIILRGAGMFGPNPKVMVTVEGSDEEYELFEYYEDEISFSSSDFPGKTIAQGRHLKFDRYKEYLQS